MSARVDMIVLTYIDAQKDEYSYIRIFASNLIQEDITDTIANSKLV